METIIVGAGPSGRAVAGRMTRKGLPYLMLEKGQHVGEAWHHHYDRLHLHTDRRFSGLPYRPIPKDYPVFVPKDSLISYWQGYAEHYGIRPLFNQDVKRIYRRENRWIVETATDRFEANQVVMCTGYNRVPYIPHWPGD